MYIQKIGILNERTFPSAGLIAYWRCNEASGTAINDCVGTRHFTITKCPWDSGGKRGYAPKITGSTSQILSNNTDIWTNAEVVSGSISMWIKKPSPPASTFTIFFGAEGWITLGCRQTTGYPRVTTDGATYKDFGSVNLCDNTWHNYILTWSNNENQIFVDGNSLGTSASSNSPTPQSSAGRTTGIGGNWSGYYYFDDGLINDVGFWSNTRLTEQQSKYIYNLGTGIFY